MSENRENLKYFGPKQILPIATFVLGLIFLVLGLSKYGFWETRQGPLPGFFPSLMAIIMLVASVLAFIFSFKEENAHWPTANWHAILSVILIFAATFIIGLLPSVFVYMLIWLRKYEGVSWKTTIISTGVTMLIVYAAFVLWLGVPFPKGIILQTVFG